MNGTAKQREYALLIIKAAIRDVDSWGVTNHENLARTAAAEFPYIDEDPEAAHNYWRIFDKTAASKLFPAWIHETTADLGAGDVIDLLKGQSAEWYVERMLRVVTWRRTKTELPMTPAQEWRLFHIGSAFDSLDELGREVLR